MTILKRDLDDQVGLRLYKIEVLKWFIKEGKDFIWANTLPHTSTWRKTDWGPCKWPDNTTQKEKQNWAMNTNPQKTLTNATA